MWKPLDDSQLEKVLHSGFIDCVCSCGKESKVRVSSLLYGETHSCKSCATRIRNLAVPEEDRKRIATKASLAAAEKLKNTLDPYVVRYGQEAIDNISNTLASAKQRCTNPNNNQYRDYGLRGIQFRFSSIREGAEWVLDNLGPKPQPDMSLDRIDNNRGYEPGNLRWATRLEQARNKRAYKRTKNGERIRAIMALRSDLTYESIRLWISKGLSDEEILGKRKYQHEHKVVSSSSV